MLLGYLNWREDKVHKAESRAQIYKQWSVLQLDNALRLDLASYMNELLQILEVAREEPLSEAKQHYLTGLMDGFLNRSNYSITVVMTQDNADQEMIDAVIAPELLQPIGDFLYRTNKYISWLKEQAVDGTISTAEVKEIIILLKSVHERGSNWLVDEETTEENANVFRAIAKRMSDSMTN